MTEGMLAAIAGLAALIFGVLQWWFSVQTAARQRDVEMTRWAGDVIDMMAELETVCSPIVNLASYSPHDAEILSYRASALVDKGRLFFPNVVAKRNRPDDEGTRVKILDEVLRACYVARCFAAENGANGMLLRGHVWDARKRFVALLQKEMGKSLRKVGHDSEGDHISANPLSWQPSTRPLNVRLSVAVKADTVPHVL